MVNPSESTYRVDWGSAFAGMGLAFFFTQGVRGSFPNWGFATLAIACFLVSGAIQRFAGGIAGRQARQP